LLEVHRTIRASRPYQQAQCHAQISQNPSKRGIRAAGAVPQWSYASRVMEAWLQSM